VLGKGKGGRSAIGEGKRGKSRGSKVGRRASSEDSAM
jgi:hypothetical protein